MTKKNHWMVLFICLIVIFPATLMAVEEKPIKFKMATTAPLRHPTFQSLKVFKSYVETVSNGKLQVVLHGASKLGGEREMAEGIQLGTIEMGIITSAVLGNFVPELNVLEVPFLFPSRQLTYKVVDGPVGKKIWESMKDYGFVGTGFYAEVGGRDYSNSKRVLRKPEDFKGLKFRVHESKIAIEMYKLLGTNPVPLPFPELFTALQKGVVDGQDLPIPATFVTKFYEVTKYITDIEFITTTMPYVANKKWFDGLPKNLQQIIIDGSEHGQLANRRFLLRFRALAKNILKAKGCVITQVTPEERQVFADRLKPLREQVVDFYGKDDRSKSRMKDLLKEIDSAIVRAQKDQ